MGAAVRLFRPCADDGTDGGISSFAWPPGMRICCTVVEGPTSLPVSRDIWAHSVAIEIDPGAVPESAPRPAPTEVEPDAGFMSLSDPPKELLEDLMKGLPEMRPYRHAVERFGAALVGLGESEGSIRAAVIESLFLPAVVTGPPDELQDGLDALRELVGDDDAEDAAFSSRVKRMRRRLA
jgi:hypothetical protein